jgi:hypothetical protein
MVWYVWYDRYSNGADNFFVDYIVDRTTVGPFPMGTNQWCYAGWNTDGNTLGTVISNALILHMYRNQPSTASANTYFNTLRILEDKYWQAIVRQQVSNYANQVGSGGSGSRMHESSTNLATDLSFYERMVFKSFDSYYSLMCQQLKVNLQLSRVSFPWNRTFEIAVFAA